MKQYCIYPTESKQFFLVKHYEPITLLFPQPELLLDDLCVMVSNQETKFDHLRFHFLEASRVAVRGLERLGLTLHKQVDYVPMITKGYIPNSVNYQEIIQHILIVYPE